MSTPPFPGWLGALVALLLTASSSWAVEVGATQQLLRQGEYEKAITAATAGLRDEPAVVEWPLVLGEALSQVGREAEASAILVRSVGKFPTDLCLGLATVEALRRSGQTQAAEKMLERLQRFVLRSSWISPSAPQRVALGRLELLAGMDPKQVLELFYDPARKAQPDLRESYLASGALALEKNDFALAARTFDAATKKLPGDPDLWLGLARAYAPSDADAARTALAEALKLNPNHPEAHLLVADQAIDSENYPQAETAIAAALKVNPRLPEAHAYRAVLAHLRGDEKAENEARASALKAWPQNAAVPHLIGRKLSQNYRFAEGATLQREALKFDPAYLPAKAQLANDLLRLGQDEEGWRLMEEVQQADPYDVVAYNFATLRAAIAKYRTLSSAHFTVRMDPREADVYGSDVLALLERAHAALTVKYGLPLRERTIVEIFADQKDFAIRTFGMPGGAGYLGVCFGHVITANSPASRPDSPANWQSILWHEFGHVVTLTLTKNKMPRWLSEGISVSEERQARSERSNANGSWGEQMKPRYRAMILGPDLTPVSQLSAAFLHPKTPAHLGFAYYESSLVVEWLVERWGLEKMKRLLAELARGTAINAALAAQFAPIETLDAEFATHAKKLAQATGPKLDWTPPAPAALANATTGAEFLAQHPNNFAALTQQAGQLLEARRWQEAKAPLEKLIELYPDQRELQNAYAQLARVHRELGETDAERAVLTRLVALSANDVEAFELLTTLAAAGQEWPAVLDFASRAQAVDPLRPAAHRAEAQAHEALGDRAAAIASYRTVLALAPPDPAEIHYRLARLLHAGGDATAKRQVLMALEEAPRYREALELLLKMNPQPSAPPRVLPGKP